MSASRDMVERAWEDVRYPKRWVRLPHKRAWIDGNGRELTDLELMQLTQQGLITKREMLERMPPP